MKWRSSPNGSVGDQSRTYSYRPQFHAMDIITNLRWRESENARNHAVEQATLAMGGALLLGPLRAVRCFIRDGPTE